MTIRMLHLLVLAIFVGTVSNSNTCLAQEGAHDLRHVELQGQPNFRDLGGYKTVDGRSVKWGEVFRTGELPKLTDKDVKRLEKLELRSVVNFLTDTEIEYHGPDRLPDGVRQVHRPIESDVGNLAQQIVEARKSADFSSIPPDINSKIHRLLITDQTARAEYAKLLRMIADPTNRPLAFHCSHGVHRTGTGAAILLSALGVPWESVREDYLLSNVYRKEEVEKRLTQFRKLAAEKQGIAADQVDMTNFNAFYVLEGEYIDAALDEIKTKYGSIEQFLLDGLGLSAGEIDRLRQELLE